MTIPSRTLSALALAALVALAGCEDPTDPVTDSDQTGAVDETGTADDTEGSTSGDGTDPDVEKPVATPAFGEIVGHAHVEYAEDLVVVDGHAYVTSKQDGLRVFDVTNPAAPTETDEIPTNDQAWDVAAGGGYVYLADYGGGLRIFDVATDPASPPEVGALEAGWTVVSVAVDPDAPRVYVGGGDGQNGRFSVIDVSDPTAPSEIGTYTDIVGPDSSASSLAYRAGYAYYGRAEGTVYALDVSDPAAIAKAGEYYHPGTAGHSPWALGLFVDGDRLYLSDWGAGVILLDISNPASPTEVSVFDEGGYAFYDTWADGDRAYIALDGGLGVLDMSDPASPSLIGGSYISTKLQWDDGLHGVWVEGDYAFVSDNKEKSLTVVYVGEGE